MFFHRGTAATDALKRNQTMLGLPHHKLITDVAMRWNSTYEMLARPGTAACNLCCPLALKYMCNLQCRFKLNFTL